MAVGGAVGAVGNSVGSDQYGVAVRTTIGKEGRAVVGIGVGVSVGQKVGVDVGTGVVTGVGADVGASVVGAGVGDGDGAAQPPQ